MIIEVSENHTHYFKIEWLKVLLNHIKIWIHIEKSTKVINTLGKYVNKPMKKEKCEC